MGITHPPRSLTDARDDSVFPLAARREPLAWSTFQTALKELRAAAGHLSVAQLIDHLLATTNIVSVYAAAADGERSLRHIEHVRAIAFDYDQKLGGSVRQFVDEIARRRHDPDEMEPSLIDEAQNAVRILTVHAAKGLEFETVILPDLDFPIGAPDAFTTEEPPSLVLRGQIETLTSYYRRAAGLQLKDIGKLREEEEMKRLFYVAVTRAMREVLFVTSSGAKKMGFFKCLDWPQSGAEIPPELPAAGRRHARLRDARLEEELRDADIVPPAIADTRYPIPELPQSARLATRAAGTLLHRVLERWDGRSPVTPLVDLLAAEGGVDRATTARVHQRLAVVAKSPTFQRIAAAETLGRELPIAIAENGRLLERRVDRWLREPEADLVVDYKSGDPAEKDVEQVAQYCRALEKMTGRPCRGLLWYIDVDRDHVVEVVSG
jgi:ATP-dependent exoDNAse (exonuclease V) beta subunit